MYCHRPNPEDGKGVSQARQNGMTHCGGLILLTYPES